MRKRLLLTSLLVASCACALASCGDNTDKSTKKESTNTSTKESTHDSEIESSSILGSTTQEETYTDFFDEKSFDLPKDFVESDLKTAKLSLKQKTLLSKAGFDSVTAAEGTVYEQYAEGYSGSLLKGNVETNISARYYSNDVFESDVNMTYTGDKIPSSSMPYKEAIAVKELKVLAKSELASTPKISSSSSLPPYYILSSMGGRYSKNQITVNTNNYTFSKYTYETGNYGSNTQTNVYKKSSSVSSNPVLSILPTPQNYYPYYNYSETYYKYNDYYVVYSDSTYNTTNEVTTGYDNENDNYITDTAQYQYSTKTISFYKENGNSFDLVFDLCFADEKSDYIYDNYTDYCVKQDKLTEIYSYKSEIKFSSRDIEFENKDEFVNGFANTCKPTAAITQKYTVTKENDTITAITSDTTNSGQYEVLSTNGNTVNADFAFNLYAGNVAQLMVPTNITTLNSDVSQDKEIDSSASISTSSTAMVELDVTSYLPDDIKTITFDNKKYINYDSELSDYYIVFVNADITFDAKGNTTATIKSVDFIKMEQTAIIDVLK